MKFVALICGLLSGAIGALAALAFLKGSKPVPLEMPASAGEDDRRKAEALHRSAALRWNKIGVTLLIGAFAFSAASSLANYLE